MARTCASRFELVRLLAEVRILSGDDARGQEAAREAAELARTIGSAVLLARSALTYGLSYSVGFTDQVMVQLLEEALATLPPGDSALRARMLARLAAALTSSRDMNPPMQIAREALAMAQRLGDDRTRLDVNHAASSALSLFAPPVERTALSREALEEAEQWNDAARAERLRDELEAIEAELVRAAGLGSRERCVGRAAERARINVQRRLADALRRIGEADAALGKHLEAAVRTGTYGSYAPDRASRTR